MAVTVGQRIIRWVARSLMMNESETDVHGATPESMSQDSITISDGHSALIGTIVRVPDGASQQVVGVDPGALLHHLHIVSDTGVIFRVAEQIGGGEVDLEGKVLLLASSSTTLGLNVLSVTIVNASGQTAMLSVSVVES